VTESRSQTFTADRHIRRRPEFQRVYKLGERVRARLMTVMVLANDRSTSRLGIAATRKIGGSVVRNRAKRLVREVFRKANVPAGLDIVVIPRPEMLDAEYRVIQAEFGYVLRRAGRAGGPVKNSGEGAGEPVENSGRDPRVPARIPARDGRSG
jgi:ribonuclease P protein component